METGKLDQAIDHLKKQSLQRGNTVRYQVVSDSMRPLIAPDDCVVVVKAAPSSLMLGDIIIWDPPVGCPIVHRIVGKKEEGKQWRYRTRGDANYREDDWFSSDAIVGKVIAIEKKATTIRLDSVAGTMISRAAVYSNSGIRTIKKLRAMCRTHVPETCTFQYQNLIFLYAVDIRTDDWRTALAENERLLEMLPPGTGVGDVQFGYGYSEAALSLLRRNIPVAGVPLLPDAAAVRQFQYLIASGFANLFPRAEQRKIFYHRLHDLLVPGGTLLLSFINAEDRIAARGSRIETEEESVENSGKEPVFPGDLMRSYLSADRAIADAAACGFSHINSVERGRVLSILMRKQ